MTSHHSFSGHETFPLRLSWLKKAVDAISEESTIFSSDQAIAAFGVGKNMVRSMRHWSLATGIVNPHPNPHARNALRVSDLGTFLLGGRGVDPYCEDAATLWLLHWLLCREPGRATLWHFIFGHWREGGLDLRNLQPALKKWLTERDSPMPSSTTLHRDLQCLQKTYVAPRWSMARLDAVEGHPLASLGLLHENAGVIYLRVGQRRSLPPEVFAYAVLDYWDRYFADRESLSTQDVLARRSSPGQIFLLSEEQAYDLVNSIEAFETPPFRFDSTAGIHQLFRETGATPQAMLDRYYSRTHVATA
ncbi:MAG: DUF4007 family protein [Bacteroidota bacterium]|nr:DUF4007 family protein [Bacteroidota bacterium]